MAQTDFGTHLRLNHLGVYKVSIKLIELGKPKLLNRKVGIQ